MYFISIYQFDLLSDQFESHKLLGLVQENPKLWLKNTENSSNFTNKNFETIKKTVDSQESLTILQVILKTD